MKKVFLLVVLALFVTFLVASAASTSLLMTADGVAVYDDTSGLYWYADLGKYPYLTNSEMVAKISTLANANWRMAKVNDMATLASYSDTEIKDAFLPSTPLTGIGWTTVSVYQGRYDGWNNNTVPMQYYGRMVWNLGNNTVLEPLHYGTCAIDSNARYGFGAWIVTNNYTPVPEPGSLVTLGTGFIGLLGFGLRRRR